MESDESILDNILKDNVRLLNNKYLIFNVVDIDDELRTSCYGILNLPTDTNQQETLSSSSQSGELYSDTNEGTNKNNQ
ncbi:late expression factor 10 [Diatraea saccharalis granulovirus]|uniref:Late expression factor 10 n=1 Tax=Diatraea saccharalis granulovirus TaxID=1675862 RepID=A0A0R7EYV3_9BBAC|nr:late expression factor 10 [Diatraea saccharalis granulovirus]AKN80763.1 late expression factor 10 [Diatraea saccharalis granulovirus]